jgi:Response regulator of the LytR/AlgR family
LPQEDGFKLLQYIPNPTFEIIFTPAYDQYAVQAFRMSAVDYLLKPIDVDQLKEAIKKIIKKGTIEHKKDQLELLTAGQIKEFDKIALPTVEGYSFIKLDDIIYCEASRSYTLFQLLNQEKIMASKSLQYFEVLLKPNPFFRITRSNIINLKYLQKYSRVQQGEVILSNDKTLPVSKHKRVAFLKLVLGK